MNVDIRLRLEVFDHPKLKKLRRRLGFAGVESLLRLWLWTAGNRPSGRLCGLDAEAVELAAGWEGDDGALCPVLVSLGLLDDVDGEFRVHDWEDHQSWASQSEERSRRARKAAQTRWGDSLTLCDMPDACSNMLDASPSNAPGTGNRKPGTESQTAASTLAQGPKRRPARSGATPGDSGDNSGGVPGASRAPGVPGESGTSGLFRSSGASGASTASGLSGANGQPASGAASTPGRHDRLDSGTAPALSGDPGRNSGTHPTGNADGVPNSGTSPTNSAAELHPPAAMSGRISRVGNSAAPAVAPTSPAVEHREKSQQKQAFVAPSAAEVWAYCHERGNAVDPERFVDYYAAQGWMTRGGQPIRDWRAVIRMWERRDRDRALLAAREAEACERAALGYAGLPCGEVRSAGPAPMVPPSPERSSGRSPEQGRSTSGPGFSPERGTPCTPELMPPEVGTERGSAGSAGRTGQAMGRYVNHPAQLLNGASPHPGRASAGAAGPEPQARSAFEAAFFSPRSGLGGFRASSIAQEQMRERDLMARMLLADTHREKERKYA